jgi:hypothetical protein
MAEEKVVIHDIPTKIEITLYRYNYLDNLIISAVKGIVNLKQSSDSKLVISKEDLKKCLKRSRIITKEIEKFSNVDPEFVTPNSVNSVFFINNILTSYKNLQEITINISPERTYSRLVQTEERSIISFFHRFLECRIDLTEHLDKIEIKHFNEFFQKMGYLNESLLSDKHYFIVPADDFIEKMMAMEDISKDFTDMYSNVYNFFFDIIENKIEQDKAKLLIVTELSE